MKTRIDQNIVVWVCATLCVFVVGCDMNGADGRPGAAERDTTSDPADDMTDDADDVTTDDVDDGDADDGDTDDQATGQLKVLITDKPYPFEFIAEALVTITRVEVHRVGDDEADTNGLDDTDTNGVADDEFGTNGGYQEGPWITISSETRDFDLVLLRNGRTDLLADAVLPAGTYNQMRLIVTGGRVTLIDTNGIDEVGTNGMDDVDTNGRVFPLRVPSGEQTGIKLHFMFEIVGDEVTKLLLDVDMSRAFKPIPGGHIDEPADIRGFKFSPSLGMRLIELLEAGSILGTVTEDLGTNGLSPLAGVTVTAYDDDDAYITTTATGEDGTYELGDLATGEYRLEFWATGYEEAELTGIAVTAGQATEGVDITLTKLPE